MKAVLFDTETTGLVKNSILPISVQPKAIEFYGILVDTDNWKILREVEFLANPGFALEPIITKITGLNDSDLVNEEPFATRLDLVEELFADADEVVAHNLKFDMNIVDFEFKRLGRECPWPDRKTCTVAGTQFIKGHRINLAALHLHLFDEVIENAHRAKNDVHALLRCFKELRTKGQI